MCAAFLAVLCAVGAAQEKKEETKPAQVELRVAVCLNAKEPTLVLMATNHGEKDFVTTEYGRPGNVLVVVGPNGKRISDAVAAGPVPRIVMAPGETKTWNSKFLQFLREIGRLKSPGLYRLTWEVGGSKSHEVLLMVEEPEPPKPPELPLTKERIEKKLKETIVSLAFDEHPAEAFKFLQTLGGVPITLDKEGIDTEKTVITLKLHNVSLETAIQSAVEQLGLKMEVREKDVYITAAKEKE
jgi:hypothetical protein